MEDNPYSTLVHALRGDVTERRQSVIRMGTVISVEPLVVSVAGFSLSGATLRVNAQLLRHAREATLTDLSGEIEDSGAIKQVTGGRISAKAELEPALEPGNQVVLLAANEGQEWVVLCKAVSG